MRHLTMLPLLSVVLLAGCATPEGNNGRIVIETRSQGQPLAAANCVVKTDGGTWKLTTPADVVIAVSDGDLHVSCNKRGYRSAETVYKAPAGIGLPSMGNSAGGGGIGLGQGMSLPMNVSDKNSAYPNRVTVELDRL
ncbi:hypothetical protein [Glaciimonas sp. PCH181]|uniref:hypothetical protein n=1 Tax=Glaciimonas sp. PCH181 TaxID=2133943 RepID=UPI000D3B9B9A|nr:hypothetical protein [Glaciimonas sp. PCH181]PUA18961.1 hypothetical protein C7W93_03355 [Glaciimonas sp. PCH181]